MQMPNTTPDFRQLCTDLADDLGFWMEYGHAPANLPLEESCTFQLLKRARSALAAKPQGPTKAEIHALAAEILDGDSASHVDFARAVLARWGKQP